MCHKFVPLNAAENSGFQPHVIRINIHNPQHQIPILKTGPYFKMEGHCLCGAITVKVHDSELFSGHRRGHLCHCRNCRRVAGGIFGTNLAIEADKVEIIGKDKLKEYMDTDTTSGIPMARCFCENCGT